MKLIYKLALVGLVIGASLPFTILKGEDGTPLLKVSDLKLPAMEFPDLSLPDWSTSNQSSKPYVSTGESTIYQWVDADGNLHFSSSPPADGVEYTSREYDPYENVIPVVDTNSDNDVNIEKKVSQTENESLFNIDGVYSPQDIVKLFEDANNVGQMQNHRIKKLDAEIGQ